MAVAGDVVNIRAGTYRETITPVNSGTPGHPITFQPDGDGLVTVSGADTADDDQPVAVSCLSGPGATRLRLNLGVRDDLR